MNLFKGLHNYFSSNNNSSSNGSNGSLRRVMRTNLYVWNILAGSTCFVNGKWQRSNTTLRNVESVCQRLNTEWGDRYMLVNFSPFLMELYENCRTGQIVDFSTHSVENFALLLELFFTINKWLALGQHEQPVNNDKQSYNNNSMDKATRLSNSLDNENERHCVVLVFLQEANAVIYPNYAAMIIACYLTFSGWNGDEEWAYPQQQQQQQQQEWERSQSEYKLNNSNNNNSRYIMNNANSFALADGDLSLNMVEQLIGIPRSTLHAASQASYVSCFQLLFITPVLPNPRRLRLTRISLHDAPHLYHRMLGLQIESNGCDKFVKLFSDPTAWKYGDAATAERYLDVNETLLGDFALQLFDYDIVKADKQPSSRSNNVTTTKTSVQTKNKNLEHESTLHSQNSSSDSNNNNNNNSRKSFVRGMVNNINASKFNNDNNNNNNNNNNNMNILSHLPASSTLFSSSFSASPRIATGTIIENKLHSEGSVVKNNNSDSSKTCNSIESSMRNQDTHFSTSALHSEWVVTKSNSFLTIPGRQEDKKYLKTRMLRLALSTIFICQTTHRVRVKDMDYALANSLGDSFYIALHFEEANEEVHDVEYVTQLSERVELSPQRVRANAISAHENDANYYYHHHHHNTNEQCYSDHDNNTQDELSWTGNKSWRQRSKYRQSLRSMRGRVNDLDEELDVHDEYNKESHSVDHTYYSEEVNDIDGEELENIVYYKSDGTCVTLKELEQLYFRKRLGSRYTLRARETPMTKHVTHNDNNNTDNNSNGEDYNKETRMQSAIRHQSKSVPLDHAVMLYLPTQLDMMDEDVRECDRDDEIAEEHKIVNMAETKPPVNNNVMECSTNEDSAVMHLCDNKHLEREKSNNQEAEMEVSVAEYGDSPAPRPPPPPQMSVKGNIPLAPPPSPMSVKGNIPLAPPPPPMSVKGNIPLAPPPPPMSVKGNIPLAPPPPPMSVKGNIPLAPPPPPMSVKGNIPLAPPPPPPHQLAETTLQHTPNRLTQRTSHILPLRSPFQNISSSSNKKASRNLFSEHNLQHYSGTIQSCEVTSVTPSQQTFPLHSTFVPPVAGPKMKTIFWKKLPRASGIWSVDTLTSITYDTNTNNNNNNNSKTQNSIGAKVLAEESVIDEPFLRALFEVKPVSTLENEKSKTQEEEKNCSNDLSKAAESSHNINNDSNNTNNTIISSSSNTKAKNKEKHVIPTSNLFTSQRLRNMGITLKRLRMSLPTLIQALLTCDTTTLNEDQRSTLLAVLPSVDEFDALLSFYEENKLIEEEEYLKLEQKEAEVVSSNHLATISANNVEEYLVYLYMYVRDCRERLQVWNTMSEMADNVERITMRLNDINNAVQVVSNKHGSLAHALRSIRALGNYVNKGTIHADALGFKLESLTQLNLVKSIDGKTSTMLEAWVLQMMEMQEQNKSQNVKMNRNIITNNVEECYHNERDKEKNTKLDPLYFVKELANLEKLTSSTLSEVGQQITQLNTFMQRLRRLQNESKNTLQWYAKRLPMCKEEGNNVDKDKLPIMIGETLSRYLTLTTQLALQYQQVKNDTSAMLVGYGEDSQSGDETIVWSYLTQFVREIQKCIDKIEHDKITKEKLIAKVHPEIVIDKSPITTTTTPTPKIKKLSMKETWSGNTNNETQTSNDTLEQATAVNKHVDPTIEL